MGSLQRRLGLFSVITISMSSMIGGGIFVLPAIGFAMTGPSLYLAFLVSALCILPAAISKAELATAMPSSGGTYVYIERTFGPLAGTIGGLGLFLSILLKASVSLYGVGAYFSIFSDFSELPIILTFLFFIVLLNIFGVGKVTKILTGILFISLISVVTLIILAIPSWELSRFTPLFPGDNGITNFFSAIALVFVTFAGVTKVAAIAEEVKNPEKNLPKGILISLFLVTVIYCTISLVLAGSFHLKDIIDGSPIYKLAYSIGGSFLGTLIAIVAILTLVNTANAGILAGSRFPFAMARDHLLPTFLGKLHKDFLTPIVSIVLSGLIMASLLTMFDVIKIAKLASAFMILTFMGDNAAVIVLRESRTLWYKPEYKGKLYPYVQIFGLLSGAILLFSMGKLAIYAVSTVTIAGLLLYFLYSKKRTTRRGVLGIRGKREDLIRPPAAEFCSFDPAGEAQVVVALFGREKSPEMLIEMGSSMVEHTHVEVAHILEMPEQSNLDDIMKEPPQMRSLRRRIIAMANEKNESITFDLVPSHDVSRTVFEISQRFHCKWLLIEWGGRNRGALTFYKPIGWLKSHLHCNIAVYRDAGVRYIRKIMIYISDDTNDALILQTADHLAKIFWADITLTKFIALPKTQEQLNDEEAKLNKYGENLKAQRCSKIITGSDKINSILEATCEFDLLILGNIQSSLLNSITGTFTDKLTAKASCSVLSVHAPRVRRKL